MKISAKGIAFIEANEGFRATPYSDNGKMAWGYGHDQKPGEAEPLFFTQAQAEALLLEDVAPIEAWLSEYETTLSQSQFDALCDFAYNLGLGALETMLKHGLAQVPAQIPRWDNVGGAPNAGLAARRAKEVALFNS